MYWLWLLPEGVALGCMALWLALRRAEFMRLTSAFGAPVALARVRWAGLAAGRRASMAAAVGWTLVSAGNLAMLWQMAVEGRRPTAFLMTQMVAVLVVWGAGIWAMRGPEPLAVFAGGVYWRRLWRWEDLSGYGWSEAGAGPAELTLYLERANGQGARGQRGGTTELHVPSGGLTAGERSTIDLLLSRHLGRNEGRSRAGAEVARP